MPKASAEEPKSGPLERYINILEVIAGAPKGLTTRELELILHLPKTSVNRLLSALFRSELVQHAGRRGAYTLGTRLTRILQADSAWTENASKRLLKALAEETGETCFIARLIGTTVESVVMESPDASVGVYVVPGHVLPPHATATGKLLTAFQTPDMIEAILQTELSQLTHRTIVDHAALLEEYRQIRKQGFATENGEHVQGLFTLACPIFLNPDIAPTHALGLTAPAERAAAQGTDKLLAKLRQTAGEFAHIFSPNTAHRSL